MQVVGREIRTEIRTVSIHSAKLHEAVCQKLLLPVEDLLLREEHVPLLVHDPFGKRRMVLVNSDRSRTSEARTRSRRS